MNKGEKTLELVVKELEQEGIKVKIKRDGNIVYIAPRSFLGRELFRTYLKIVKKNGFEYDSSRDVWFKEL